jgi:hypothetical protein
MRSFTEYWNEKSAKRKKSWAARAKRFAEKHMQLEEIRSEIIYSHMKREEVRRLLDEHRTVQNPIARWGSNMHFSFSEQGLIEAMQAEGADVSSLTMTISKKNIVGQQPHEIAYGDMLDVASNRRDLYEKYTDLETCTINYREVTMVIYRYTYLQQPFALYELVPCKQLSISDLRLEETSFNTLNIATFLMEMAAEYELRQEELNYHAKKLKLRTMAAATTDSIEFEPWDDKKLQKKVLEYIGKEYKLDKIVEQVIRPWKSAVKKYIEAETERSLIKQAETFEHFEYHDYRSESFVESVFIPYLKEAGLQDVEIVHPEKRGVTMKYQGFQSSIISDNFLFFYPNAHYFPDVCFDRRSIQISCETPLSAIADFLKMMPSLNQRMDETILKVMHIYDEQMMQNPAYRAAVEHLETLAKQYAGKPVGKLMKYLRWEVGRLLGRRFLIPTIKVIDDTAFSFVEKKRKDFKNNNWIYEDVVQQRWLDTECQKVYFGNPVSTDADTRIKSLTIHHLISEYMSGDSYPFLSIDFIEQKL